MLNSIYLNHNVYLHVLDNKNRSYYYETIDKNHNKIVDNKTTVIKEISDAYQPELSPAIPLRDTIVIASRET